MPARQQGGASLLEDYTHVLLAPKLGHFLDIVNIKHYCNFFRTLNYIKFYLVTGAIQYFVKNINGILFCKRD